MHMVVAPSLPAMMEQESFVVTPSSEPEESKWAAAGDEEKEEIMPFEDSTLSCEDSEMIAEHSKEMSIESQREQFLHESGPLFDSAVDSLMMNKGSHGAQDQALSWPRDLNTDEPNGALYGGAMSCFDHNSGHKGQLRTEACQTRSYQDPRSAILPSSVPEAKFFIQQKADHLKEEFF
uniref:Uncharacterized protein n=1 Tax=Trieres chinensis TaxID=1514140 RepID=A0A7S2A8G7_TRICV|mmetsp:Transcript_6912/g.14566  ORF Transcript_6912/g.14566 Transcript_6912/m.14566 type:complete len:178 (+) Transcript_6912:539-1072(+)